MNGDSYNQVILLSMVILGAFLGFMAGMLWKIKLMMDLKIREAELRRKADTAEESCRLAEQELQDTLVDFVAYYKGQASGFTAPVPAKGLQAISDPHTVDAAKKQNASNLPKKKKGTAPSKTPQEITKDNAVAVRMEAAALPVEPPPNTFVKLRLDDSARTALMKKVGCVDCDYPYGHGEDVVEAILLPGNTKVFGHKECVTKLQQDYREGHASDRRDIIAIAENQRKELLDMEYESKENPGDYTDVDGVVWTFAGDSGKWVSQNGDVTTSHPANRAGI